MVVAYLLDYNFTKFEEKPSVKIKLFHFEKWSSCKISKNAPSCGAKMSPSDIVFKNSCLQLFSKTFLRNVHTKFRLCSETIRG